MLIKDIKEKYIPQSRKIEKLVPIYTPNADAGPETSTQSSSTIDQFPSEWGNIKIQLGRVIRTFLRCKFATDGYVNRKRQDHAAF